MKKSVVYGLTAGVLGVSGVLGAFAAAGLPNAEAREVAYVSEVVSELGSGRKVANSKDEMVYVMTDADGTVRNKFIGSAIYSGSEELPFSMNVRYYLDGAETSASEIAGKSGHAKISYDFESRAWYNGTRIPFLTVTGLSFDSSKFSNVKVSHGKVVSEGESYMVVGYALPGAGETLGTNILPSGFSIEADVTEFSVGTGYTLAMNDFLAEVDTSKLADVDGLVSSMNQLAEGLDKIIEGAGTLSNGMESLITNTKLIAEGMEGLSNGLNELTGYNDMLNGGAKKTFLALLAQANATIYAKTGTNPELSIEDYATKLDGMIAMTEKAGGDATELQALKGSLDEYNAFYTGLAGYTAGVSDAAAGAEEIASKMPALVAGEEQLYAGAGQLSDGLNEFKTSGVDRLVKFANEDLAAFTRNARRMVTAAGSYKSFGDVNAETVKFVVKTASIK